jgi:hypothetical protein
MTVVLNHTIVSVGDRLRGAQVLADLLGLRGRGARRAARASAHQ